MLHTGSAVLPARPRVRASWNYTLSSCRADSEAVQVSYYMNRLQRLGGERDYVVTLDGDASLAGGEVLDRMEYAHPPSPVGAGRGALTGSAFAQQAPVSAGTRPGKPSGRPVTAEPHSPTQPAFAQ